MDTQTLLKKIRDGDQEAREVLFERYYNEVMRIVRFRIGRMLRSKMESVDLAQSVFLDVARDLPAFDYRGEGSFKDWLSRVVENKIRLRASHFKALKRDPAREQAQSQPDLLPGSTPTPSQNFARDELVLAIEEGMEQLPEDYREVIIQRKFLGRSWDEVAETLGKTKNAAQVFYQRAFEKLTGLLPADAREQIRAAGRKKEG